MRLTTKERNEQTERNADDDAGDDREIKRGTAAFDPDITGQTPEPTGTEAAPEGEPEKHHYTAKNDQQFSELGHQATNMCQHGRQPRISVVG